MRRTVHFGAFHVTGGLAAIGSHSTDGNKGCSARAKRTYTYIIASPDWRRVTCKVCRKNKKQTRKAGDE